MSSQADLLWQALGVLFQSHPWHGVSPGPQMPEVVTCFIEMVPTDTVKYEIDKITGLLKIDRPQKFSSVVPTLYGFIPQTLCAEQVAARARRPGLVGDGDPIDVCVLSERPILHGNVLVDAVPIGGLRMIDGDEADDKIIAVLAGDPAFKDITDVAACPSGLRDRLQHYFLTYKQPPDGSPSRVEIAEVYGREEAHQVIQASIADYKTSFAGLHDMVAAAIRP